MARTAGDLPLVPAFAAGRRTVHMWASVDVGGTGAPTIATANSTPGITVTRTGVGAYDLVYPACQQAFINITLKSAAGTVKTAWFIAKAPTSGTASFALGNGGGTATEAASGDVIDIVIEAIPSRVG